MTWPRLGHSGRVVAGHSAMSAVATRMGSERQADAPLAGSLLKYLRRGRHVPHQQAFGLLGRTHDAAMLAGGTEAERLVKAHRIAVGVGDPRVDFHGAFAGEPRACRVDQQLAASP